MNQRAYPHCSVGMTVQMIGGKWKAVILHYLFERGKLRFGELRSLVEHITQRMLTLQLRELEATGLVRRKIYPVVPPRVEYSLTEFGRSLEPVIAAMKVWGKRYEQRCEPHTIPSDELLVAVPGGGRPRFSAK